MDIMIDGKVCHGDYGETILDVARRNHIHIPTLCHNDAFSGQGNCRLCIVEVIEKGKKRIVTSCIYPITKDIEVVTNCDKIRRMRKTILMLLSARMPRNSYLEGLMKEYGGGDTQRFTADMDGECILCGLCVMACDEVGSSAITTINRGIMKKVSTPYDEPSEVCIGCGACAYVCPTGSIKVKEQNGKRIIWNKSFALIKCEKCGKYFATQEQMAYIHSRLNNHQEACLCHECKRITSAERIKNIYGYIP